LLDYLYEQPIVTVTLLEKRLESGFWCCSSRQRTPLRLAVAPDALRLGFAAGCEARLCLAFAPDAPRLGFAAGCEARLCLAVSHGRAPLRLRRRV
jgi:hypothetical protein